MPKSKSFRFRRPKKTGIRKSKNAQYAAPLKGQVGSIINFGSFTRRQTTLLTIAGLSFYLFISFAVMKTLGVTAGMPLLAGLLVFVVAIVLVLWFYNRSFHGDPDSDQFSDEEDLIYPGSQSVKSARQAKKLATIDRVEFSEIQEGDIPLIIKPAPIIQAITQDVNTDQPSIKQNVNVAQPSIKRSKRARVDLERAKQHYRSGAALLKQDQLEEAMGNFQKAIELNPDLAKAHEGLGRVYLKQAKYQPAIIAFQTAIACSPDLVAAHEGLGRSLLHQERLEDAKAAFQKAVQLDAQFFRAYDGLGRSLFKMGQVEGAIQQLQKALEINPKYQPALSMLRRAEAQSGKA